MMSSNYVFYLHKTERHLAEDYAHIVHWNHYYSIYQFWIACGVFLAWLCRSLLAAVFSTMHLSADRSLTTGTCMHHDDLDWDWAASILRVSRLVTMCMYYRFLTTDRGTQIKHEALQELPVTWLQSIAVSEHFSRSLNFSSSGCTEIFAYYCFVSAGATTGQEVQGQLTIWNTGSFLTRRVQVSSNIIIISVFKN